MFYTFLIISYSFYLPAAITGLIFFNRINAQAKFLLIFLLFELIVETYCNYLPLHNKNNLWLYNIFILFETGTFGGILLSYIANKSIRKIGIVLSALFLLLWCIMNIITGSIFVFHPEVQVFQCLLLIFLSGYLMIHLSNVSENLFHDSRFWIASAFIIYFVTTLFVAAITSVITKPGNHSMANLWIINSVANMFSHILFIFYFLWNSRRKILFY